MTGDNEDLGKKVSELERLLEKSKEKARYYKQIAKDAGKKRLREINQFSGLISERKRVEKDLRRSEELLRAVFNAAENVSFLIATVENEQDNNPIIIEYSPGAEKIFGYKRDEILGKPVSTLHSPESADFSEMHRNMRKSKMGFSGETTLVRKSGDRFPALLSTYPLIDAEIVQKETF